ncbi:MAG: phytanoyl-CoA dioxygenase family protein [Chrysiogenetes bacterium]|nr:phytanoyl-CoA dioxygenase family protein [Chrysiogenetes bacterium]
MRRHDLYPSREEKPRIHERRDPVLYNDPRPSMTGLIDEAAARFYDQNGFLHFEGLLDEEEIRRLREIARRVEQDPGAFASDEAAIVGTESGVHSVFGAHQSSEVIAEAASNPKLLEIAEHLLGSTLSIYQTRMHFEPGYDVAEERPSWRSDFETWHVEDGMARMRAVSCAITLEEDKTRESGLLMIPGSQGQFIGCASPEDEVALPLLDPLTQPDEALVQCLARDHGVASPEGKLGSVTFFDSNIMRTWLKSHERSNRVAAAFVYNSTENLPAAPFGGDTPRPEVISDRRADPLPSVWCL